MSLPTPSIDQAGRSAIDQFLAETVSSRRVPATFLGVTTAKEELYFNQDGERVFGHPDQGLVDDQTSEQPLEIILVGPCSDRTVLQLFSTTKLVTAVRHSGSYLNHTFVLSFLHHSQAGLCYTREKGIPLCPSVHPLSDIETR